MEESMSIVDDKIISHMEKKEKEILKKLYFGVEEINPATGNTILALPSGATYQRMPNGSLKRIRV